MTTRLLIAFVAVSAFVLAVLVVPLGITNQRSVRDDLTRRVERDAVAVAAVAADPLRASAGRRYTARLTRYLDDYTDRTGARVVVVDADGTALVDTVAPEERAAEGERDFSTRPEIRRALDGEVSSGERASRTLGYDLLYVATPVSSGGRALGAVRVSYPTSELDERVRRYWYGLAAIALTVVALASVIGALLAAWLARPLRRLAETADAMGDGDLAVRADVRSGPPEVRDLAGRFNDSVATLERVVAEQQAFVADASHQLRTPLQALRLRLENAQADVEAGRTGDADEALERAVGEVDRLAALVTALLVLERADRGAASELEEVDVADLLDRREPDWIDLGARRGVQVQVHAAPGLVAAARAVHVEQVLDNLVDNAVAVTPAGATVEVHARTRDGAVQLHVVDRGPGMTEAQVERAFRRFATGTDVSPVSPSGGFGIGLAIVRRLTELDGGTVELRPTAHGGLDAVVTYRAPA